MITIKTGPIKGKGRKDRYSSLSYPWVNFML
jgi:hypothetical protein